MPVFSHLKSDAAKRFILLIDTLYDRGVKLVASFAAPLDQLAHNDKTRFEFARCLSRLEEMRSADYIAQPLRRAGARFLERRAFYRTQCAAPVLCLRIDFPKTARTLFGPMLRAF